MDQHTFMAPQNSTSFGIPTDAMAAMSRAIAATAAHSRAISKFLLGFLNTNAGRVSRAAIPAKTNAKVMLGATGMNPNHDARRWIIRESGK